MTGSAEEQELKDRLRLIENMIIEGQQTTQRWGWAFVFWGVAYYLAIAWSTLGKSEWAWPVTMIVASLLAGILVSRKASKHPGTTIGRAIGAVWIAFGISIFLLLCSLGASGRYEPHLFVAIIGAMLGGANATCSMILRWKMQFACALVWWTSAIIGCFGSETAGSVAFLLAIFFCLILFGIYCMVSESRKRGLSGRNRDEAHA